MSAVRLEDNRVRVGDRFSVSFQRTLRIPDDGKQYPLPPGLGRFPVLPAAACRRPRPSTWQGEHVFVIPMYQREALWLGFDGEVWKPNAVKIGVGRVNALTGAAWDDRLSGAPQDYLVTPDQPWLDGVKTAAGTIRQFVALPLGSGYTVEAQVTGAEQHGGIQILVFEPKPQRFPDGPPPAPVGGPGDLPAMGLSSELGLGAGGQMKQKLYLDPYGVDTWDLSSGIAVEVHIVNSLQSAELTGRRPPPSPISAKTYTEYGLPWFDLYDEEKGDLPAASELARVKGVAELDRERGERRHQGDQPIEIEPSNVRKLHPPSRHRERNRDGPDPGIGA